MITNADQYKASDPIKIRGRWYSTCSCGQYKNNGAPYPGHAQVAVDQHIRDKHTQPRR